MRGTAASDNQWIVRFEPVAILLAVFIAAASAQTPSSLREAAARNNLAIQRMQEGRNEEAEALYRGALEAARNDDVASAKIANNLGELYRRLDRYPDAERMFRAALEWRQKALPASSLEVADSLNNLGEIYRVEGRDWEARNLMEAAARKLDQYHPGSPDDAIVQGNLAVVVCRFGEFDRAEELLRSALLSYQRRHATSTREYAIALLNLAEILKTKKEFQAALPLYDQAVGIFENMAPAGRTDLAGTLANQGELFDRLGRRDEARQTEQRALQLLRPDGDALLRSRILRNLGNIVAGGSKPADSAPYFEQSLMLEEKTLGDQHPEAAGILLDYASATQKAGNKSLARKLRRRAQELIAHLHDLSLQQMTVSLRDLGENK